MHGHGHGEAVRVGVEIGSQRHHHPTVDHISGEKSTRKIPISDHHLTDDNGEYEFVWASLKNQPTAHQCTMRTLISSNSSRLFALGHILKTLIKYTIDHIFFLVQTTRRKIEKIRFSNVAQVTIKSMDPFC